MCTLCSFTKDKVIVYKNVFNIVSSFEVQCKLRVVEGHPPSFKKVTTIKQWAPSSTIVCGVGLGWVGLGWVWGEIGNRYHTN